MKKAAPPLAGRARGELDVLGRGGAAQLGRAGAEALQPEELQGHRVAARVPPRRGHALEEPVAENTRIIRVFFAYFYKIRVFLAYFLNRIRVFFAYFYEIRVFL